MIPLGFVVNLTFQIGHSSRLQLRIVAIDRNNHFEKILKKSQGDPIIY